MTSGLPLAFALSPRSDKAELAARFAQSGVVSVSDILSQDSASALHAMLRERQNWKQVIGGGKTISGLDRATRAGLSEEQRTALDQAVYAQAREGFTFRYETLRVSDDPAERARSDDPLARFAAWWSSEPVLAFLREITGLAHIAFADAQATAYSPGDFLTGHDDDVTGKNRLAAYVLNLTPKWRTEWGGLLAFHDDSSPEVIALSPAFNRLNLFKVPRRHSVTEVTRSAAYRRYAITGWLRY